MKKDKKTIFKLVAVLLAIVFCFGAVFIGIDLIENNYVGKMDDEALLGADTGEYNQIEKDGKTYELKSRVETILLIGLDNYGHVQDSQSYTNSQQADFLALLVIDRKAEECTIIHINRDTMADIPMLGFNGDRVGTISAQLALAHTYGSGMQDSCRNTVDAVSELLGVRIDSYMSLTMGAIGTINDMIGGVEVEVLEDFSKYDPELVKGATVTLKNEQALTYVRMRMDVGDQTNMSRMIRQKQYMTSFVDKFVAEYENNNHIIIDAIEQVGDYMVTDMTAQELNNMAQYMSTYTLGDIVTPAGENVMGDKYIEHYINQDALLDMIIDVFYEEI